jgi:hypothetical protein
VEATAGMNRSTRKRFLGVAVTVQGSDVSIKVKLEKSVQDKNHRKDSTPDEHAMPAS